MAFFTQTASSVVEKSNRFRLFKEAFDLSLNRLGRAGAEFGLALTLFEALFDHLIQRMEQFRTPGRPLYTQWALDAPGVLERPVTSPYMRAEAMSATQFLAELSLVATSRPVLFLDRRLAVTVSCLGADVEERDSELKQSLFGALRRNSVAGEYEFVMRKKAPVITVPSIVYAADCLLASIVLGLDILSCRGTDRWKRRKMFTQPLLSQKLRMGIIQLAKCFPNINFDQPQGRTECQQIQKHLMDRHSVSLVIYEGFNYTRVFFRGPRKSEKQIHLLKLEGHLSLIVNYRALFGLHECGGCLRLYEAGKHKFCFGRRKGRECKKCLSTECSRVGGQNAVGSADVKDERPTLICQSCGGIWTRRCFDAHKKTSCPYFVFCSRCARRVPRAEMGNHAASCLKVQCKNCGHTYSTDQGQRHFCAVQRPNASSIGITKSWAAAIGYRPDKPPDLQKSIDGRVESSYSAIVGELGICCFDVETRVGADAKLRPVLISAVFACSQCAFRDYLKPETWLQSSYSCCGQVRKKTYVGDEIRQFILDLFFQKTTRRLIGLAHYGSGFDFVFIANALLANG